jgi:hypothetical protein
MTLSDRALKRDIQPLSNSLKKVSNIRGVHFSWAKGEAAGFALDTERHIGFIAQDIQKELPDLVQQIVGSDVLAVNYMTLIPILSDAIKELDNKYNSRIKELERDLVQLRSSIVDQERRLSDLLKYVL